MRVSSCIGLIIAGWVVFAPLSGEACSQSTPKVEVNATTLRGRVRDAKKSPVESASITASRVVYRFVKHKSGAKGYYAFAEVLPAMRRTVTDNEGRFSLGSLDPGTYVVRVAGESFRLVVNRPSKEKERFVDVVMWGGV